MMSKTISRNNRRSREEWERLMAEYEAGEVSQRVFCAERSLAYSSFGYWRKQLRGGLPAEDKQMPALVEMPALRRLSVEGTPERLMSSRCVFKFLGDLLRKFGISLLHMNKHQLTYANAPRKGSPNEREL